MIKYRYALNESGQTVCADDIAGQFIFEKFSCLGCGGDLIAKVNGTKMKPHFAHKVQVECSGETYLHRLGKKVFFETYKKCLDSNDSFNIRLRGEKVCKKYYPSIMTGCNIGFLDKEYDLTNHYQDIFEEKRDGQFIPDVLLVSKKKPSEKIYIEIACTHFISEEKERSHNRIIEIPIESEQDIEKIRSRLLSHENASFIGFNQKTTAITDAECVCSSKDAYGFFVLQSGKSFLDYGKLQSIYHETKRNDVIYFNILIADEIKRRYSFQDQADSGYLYINQVFAAEKECIPIKSCYLCRYHGDNKNSVDKSGIFCKTFRKTCKSNDAAECERYRK